MKKGYKQTEIGVIPEDWGVIPFSKCFDTIKNNTLSRAELNYDSGNIRNIHYGDVLINFPSIVDCQKETIPYVNEDATDSAGNIFLQDGDVVIADTAEDNTVGKAVEVFNIGDSRVVAGLHTMPCRPKNKFAEKFLGYYINARVFHDQIIPFITGTKVSSISKKAIDDTTVLVPPFAEQKRIAEALSDVDELIASLEKLIEKKKALKQGVMQELLTGKRRLPGFTGEWIEKSIGELGSFVSGNGFPLIYQGEKSGHYPFYKVSDFNNVGNENYLTVANNYVEPSVIEHLHCNIIPAKSIVFAKIGAAIFLERKKLSSTACCIDNNMMAFQPNEKVHPNFIWHLFQTISFGSLVEATALPSLSGKTIGDVRIQLPILKDEQIAIANTLDELQNDISSSKKKLQKYKKLKSGTMSELLTGRIRLV